MISELKQKFNEILNQKENKHYGKHLHPNDTGF